jgi:hypothetical protein
MGNINLNALKAVEEAANGIKKKRKVRDMSRDFLGELRDKAKENGFELLDTEWKKSTHEYKLLHIPSNIIYKRSHANIIQSGFPQEPIINFKRIKELAILASASGYKILESEWCESKEEYAFLHIKSNREYNYSYKYIKGAGFPKDPRDGSERLEDLAKKATSNGFKLLDSEWRTSKSKYRFFHIESNTTHEWVYDQVWHGPFPKDLRTNAEKLDQLAKKANDSGFSLLDSEWKKSKSKYNFLHVESGKIYPWSWDQIMRDGFPNVDGGYITQEVCRQVFCHVFGGEFKTNRDRLIEVHGNKMELDGYEEFNQVPSNLYLNEDSHDIDGSEIGFKLNIAFEFQGHRSHFEDEKTIQRDQLKKKLCEFDGILLVQINPPNWNKVRDSKYMYEFVCNFIREAVSYVGHVNFPNPDSFQIDLSNFKEDRNRYNELVELAIKNGFELIEDGFLGNDIYHRFKHIDTGIVRSWVPSQVKRAFPEDLRTLDEKNEDSFNELKNIAFAGGFLLLEKSYLGRNDIPHRFQHIKTGIERPWTPSQIKKQGFPKDLRIKEQKDAAQLARLRAIALENNCDLIETDWHGIDFEYTFSNFQTGKKGAVLARQIFDQGFPKSLLSQAEKSLYRYIKLKNFAEKSGFQLEEKEFLGLDKPHKFVHIESGDIVVRRPDKLYRLSADGTHQVGFPAKYRRSMEEKESFAEVPRG